jgi:site-specific recombinase XerD
VCGDDDAIAIRLREGVARHRHPPRSDPLLFGGELLAQHEEALRLIDERRFPLLGAENGALLSGMSFYALSIPTPAKVLSAREQAALLATTGERRSGFRDHILFALALGTGLREHELVALDIADVVDAEGTTRRRLVLRVFKRASDTPALQEVLLSETLRTKVTKFLEWKRRHGEDVADTAPMFVSQKGGRLSTRQVRTLFRTWQERAGFERFYTFHALRHTACTSVYRRSKDLRLTQRFARHRSIHSTARYSHPDEAELLRVVQELPC